MKKTISLFLLMGGFFFSSWAISAQNKISLPDMDLSLAYQQYGSPMKNAAVTGEKLTVGGEHFGQGVGVQANSKIKLSLRKNTGLFTCKVGVNDRSLDYKKEDFSKIPMTDGTMLFYRTDGTGGKKQFVGVGAGDGSFDKGSVVFRLVGDGKELYNSGMVRGGEKAREVSLDVSGVDVLELVVEDGGDGVSGDHADWIEPVFSYNEIKPSLVNADYKGTIETMPAEVERALRSKVAALPAIDLPVARPESDWLLDAKGVKAGVYQTHNGKDIVLSNGLVSRIFRIYPNLATVDLVNQMTGESMLRAVSNEGVLKIDDKVYTLGGLDGQFEYGYTQYKWVDSLTILPNSFRVTGFDITELAPRIDWANKRWSLVKPGETTGKVLSFYLEGPDYLKGVKVKLNYALYDGIPCISKWMEIENKSGMGITLDEFTLEQLAMAEPESPVEAKRPEQFLKPNIHVESDWAFLGFTEREADRTEFWNTDPRYTSQCNYPLLTPCLLEVKLPMGPDEDIPDGAKFNSFRTWLMPFDSDDRDRKGLFLKRMYRKIAPWTTENPIFLHCVSSDPKVVKTAIDQCAETGYEMVILSFGSGLNMEDESEANIAKFKEFTEYANSKGIELGGYSLLSSRWISDEVDVINPETGKRGGMIFGSSPCLSSEWGYDYFRKIRSFYEKTGMTVFENAGSYPGNVCASTSHAHHKGLKDSQWKQRQQIVNLYQWMCENGIYTNIPDFGYMLNGGTKVGIGYREVNWSLPRERQLVLGRQVMYDGLWERLPGMCWTFVPLTQYHGGGAAATLEPLKDHIPDYKAHMIQNYGAGVQACYRGPRLYDTPETKAAVVEVIDWYKKYRTILNSELIHLRRADGRDWDGFMHVDPEGKEKGFALLFNPTDKAITRTIRLPLYYTGISDVAKIREKENAPVTYKLNRDYTVDIKVTIPARGNTWLVVEK